MEAEMLFLTEVLGAELVDVRQRRSGRVRDLAVRIQEPYPVVTGMVVSRSRELVIPWSSVRAIARSIVERERVSMAFVGSRVET